MSRAFELECPHCGERNSLIRVLFHVSGVHIRCRSCHRTTRAVETVSGVFLMFLAFAAAYGAAFWWLSGVWPPDTWTTWKVPASVVGLPLVPGSLGALAAVAIARRFSGDVPAEARLSPAVFGATYALALISTIALLLALWAGGLLIRMGEPMPAPELPESPGTAVVEHLADWRFTEIGGPDHLIGELQGSPVLMMFWRPEDQGIIDVLASVKRLRKSVDGVYYVLVGDGDEEHVREFVAERAPALPYVIAAAPVPDGLVAYRSLTTTTTYFLDAKGRLAYVHSGPARWDTDGVRRFLDALR